jgi:hypothetical protein
LTCINPVALHAGHICATRQPRFASEQLERRGRTQHDASPQEPLKKAFVLKKALENA